MYNLSYTEVTVHRPSPYQHGSSAQSNFVHSTNDDATEPNHLVNPLYRYDVSYCMTPKMKSVAVPMTKMKLKTIKQTRSMTAAAIIHSFIIC